VINTLPFPALDGGRLLFIIYEALTRRRPKPSFERWTNAIGMALILFLVLLVTINDVARLLETTNFLSRLRSLWPF
jgi:regulator of sigma E protease